MIIILKIKKKKIRNEIKSALNKNESKQNEIDETKNIIIIL